MAKPKHATSLRLSPEAKRLLEELANRLGVSRSAVLELAIREYARREGIDTRALIEEDRDNGKA